MADEVKVRAWLGFDFGGTREGLGVGTEPPDEVTFDYEGNQGDGLARILRRTQLITSSIELLSYTSGSDIDFGGYIIIRNLGPDSVNLYASNNVDQLPFSSLGVGDVALFRTQEVGDAIVAASTNDIGDEARLSFFVISGPPPV